MARPSKFSPEVRERAVRLVLEGPGDHGPVGRERFVPLHDAHMPGVGLLCRTAKGDDAWLHDCVEIPLPGFDNEKARAFVPRDGAPG